jgi:hypothetical protein
VLYRSVRRLLARRRTPACTSATTTGRRPGPLSSTVAEQRAAASTCDGVDEAEFVAMRRQRDATLAMPTLLLPSVQVNMRAGHLPPPKTMAPLPQDSPRPALTHGVLPHPAQAPGPRLFAIPMGLCGLSLAWWRPPR